MISFDGQIHNNSRTTEALSGPIRTGLCGPVYLYQFDTICFSERIRLHLDFFKIIKACMVIDLGGILPGVIC